MKTQITLALFLRGSASGDDNSNLSRVLCFAGVATSLDLSGGVQVAGSLVKEDDCDQISECTWISNSSSSGSYCKSPSSLAAWNGATNGGEYHVIWLEMSASW